MAQLSKDDLFIPMHVPHTLASLIVLLGAATAAAKETSQKIVVSLEVPQGYAPQYVCVVTQGGGCKRDCRDLEILGNDYFDNDKGTVTVKPTVAKSPILPALAIPLLLLRRTKESTLPPALAAALRALRRVEPSSCAHSDPRCQRSIEIDKAHPDASPKLSGNLTCAYNVRNTEGERVAFVSLYYHRRNAKVGVESAELLGTELTLQLAHDSDPADFAFLVGVGGDYKSNTTSVATRERAQLTLWPRCTTVPIDLPPRRSTPKESLSVTVNENKPATCSSSGAIAPLIEIPTQTMGSKSMLGVMIRSPDGTSEESYEAVWTEPLPPRPLHLRYRAVEFEWSRHCLTGSIPDAKPEVASATQWTALCPTPELPVAGAECETLPSDEKQCSYRCKALSSMPAFTLPTPVRFTRKGELPIHAFDNENANRSAEIDYSWDDKLSYEGEVLKSFASASERRLQVRFENVCPWLKGVPGDKIRSLALRTSSGDRSEFMPTTKDKDRCLTSAVPGLVSVPTRNLTCGDHVTLSVDGDRPFDDELFHVRGGGIVVRAPDDYRRPGVFGVFAGSGGSIMRSNARPELTVSIAGFYYSRLFSRRWMLDIEAGHEFVRTTYGVAHPDPEDDAAFPTRAYTWYHRLNLRAGLEWSWRGNWLRVGGLLGGGIGIPNFRSQTARLGTHNPFFFTGGNIRLLISDTRRLWLEFLVGLRLREARYEFDNRGFVGDPTPLITWPVAGVGELRIRFGY